MNGKIQSKKGLQNANLPQSAGCAERGKRFAGNFFGKFPDLFTFAVPKRERQSDGVTVALQILVLSVLVRIQVGLLSKAAFLKQKAAFLCPVWPFPEMKSSGNLVAAVLCVQELFRFAKRKAVLIKRFPEDYQTKTRHRPSGAKHGAESDLTKAGHRKCEVASPFRSVPRKDP